MQINAHQGAIGNRLKKVRMYAKCKNPQSAGRAFVRTASLLLCPVNVGKDLLTVMQISVAGRRERKTSRRTVQQTGLQMGFEFRYRSRHAPSRRIERPGSGGETAGHHDSRERAHILQCVHRTFNFGNKPFLAGEMR